MKRHLAMAFLSAVLASCDQGEHTLTHHYESPSGRGWSVRDTLLYTLPEVGETADYRFSVGMRLGISFPYSGVWLVAETHIHNPDTLMRDTLHFATMRPGGMPIGSGVSLQHVERSVATIRLKRGQTGEVLVYHIMQREELPDVIDVGVRVWRQ